MFIYNENYKNTRILLISFIAFTTCFAVWTIFSIIGISIKKELGLSDTQFGILIATPILTGSLTRLVFGVWTDQYGGRAIFFIVMIMSSLCVYTLSIVNTYAMYLLVALGVGFSGGTFAIGIAYVSAFFPIKQQGTVLGIYGMGNAGAAITNFLAPFLLVGYGWIFVTKVYSISLIIIAIIFLLLTEDDPNLQKRRKDNIKPKTFLEQITPLKYPQVWRFSFYYLFVFGGFLALALWLPRYYMAVYGVSIKTAGILTSLYSFPGSVFRACGGWASDYWGARKVMYWTFISSVICLFILSYPVTECIVHGTKEDIYFTLKLDIIPFCFITIVLGFFMSLGKAAVYKHIPVYYKNNIGAVGGIVGLVGGLGGFLLPIIFGIMNDYIKVWTSCFMILFLITAMLLIIMHYSIIKIEKEKFKENNTQPLIEFASFYKN